MPTDREWKEGIAELETLRAGLQALLKMSPANSSIARPKHVPPRRRPKDFVKCQDPTCAIGIEGRPPRRPHCHPVF